MESATARILAEVLRLQRWAGGAPLDAARIFGLLHGFESVLREQKQEGISETTQEAVEDLLHEIESNGQVPDGLALKDRLNRQGIDEVVAERVMQLCRLQGRFVEAVDKVAAAQGSTFATLKRNRPPEEDWFGPLHFMELFDSTEGAKKKLHAVFGPSVPRVGETVTPERGSPMEVVAVDYAIVCREESNQNPILIPNVILEAIDDEPGEG